MTDRRGSDLRGIDRRTYIAGLGTLAAAGLAGCSGGGGGNNGGGGGTASGGGTGSSGGSKQNLDLWLFGGIPAERDWFKKHYSAYSDAKVRYTHKQWGKKYQIVVSAKASNSLPEVMSGQGLLIPDYASAGAIQPLDQDGYAADLKKANEPFVDADVKAQMYSDIGDASGQHQWGLPGGYSDLGAFIDIRKDFMQQAGFDSPPRSWDELVEYGKAFKKLDGTTAGIVTCGQDFGLTTGYFIGFVYQNGGRYFDPDTMKATVDQPGFVDAVKLYQDIAEAGLWQDSVVEDDHIAAGRYITQKKAGIFITYSHANAIYQTIGADQSWLDGEGHITTRAPLPQSVSGNFDPKNLLIQNAQDFMLATGGSQAQTDAAFDYIKWWNEPAQLAPWTYDPDHDVGIRGRVPTLKSAFEQPTSLMKKQYGDLLNLYGQNKLFSKTTRFPSFSGLSSIQSQINRNVLQPVMLGQKTAEEACKAINPKIQSIIDNNLKSS